MTKELSHLDEHGRASMVNIGDKPIVHREAVAEAFFRASAETLDLIEAGEVPKGEALAVARIAGIQAAKKCDDLIPLCHSLPLDSVSVTFDRAAPDRLRISASASTSAKTGVEMEALAAVCIAALTLYDMTKAIDRELRIEDVRLVSKRKSDERRRT